MSSAASGQEWVDISRLLLRKRLAIEVRCGEVPGWECERVFFSNRGSPWIDVELPIRQEKSQWVQRRSYHRCCQQND
jgi:hypothetical protein